MCEHLDSLCDKKDLFLEKFNNDLSTIKKPSTSAYIALIADETDVDKDMINYLLECFITLEKPIRKIAFVGFNNKCKKIISKKNKETHILMKCIDDLEQAKFWLIDNR